MFGNKENLTFNIVIEKLFSQKGENEFNILID